MSAWALWTMLGLVAALVVFLAWLVIDYERGKRRRSGA